MQSHPVFAGWKPRRQLATWAVLAFACWSASIPATLVAQTLGLPNRNLTLQYTPLGSPNPQLRCGTTLTTFTGEGTNSASCAVENNGYLSGLTETVAGRVRVSAGVANNQTLARRGGGEVWVAGASGVWADRLTFSGGEATTLEMSFRWSGLYDVGVQDFGPTFGPLAYADADWGMLARGSDNVDLARYRNTISVVTRYDRSRVESGLINDRQTFSMSLVGQSGAPLGFVNFLHYIRLGTSTQTYVTRVGELWSARAGLNFLDTGVLTGIVFRNAAGDDVTSAVTYSFANGTVVDSPSVVPEPLPVELLGIALLTSLTMIRAHRSSRRSPERVS